MPRPVSKGTVPGDCSKFEVGGLEGGMEEGGLEGGFKVSLEGGLRVEERWYLLVAVEGLVS